MFEMHALIEAGTLEGQALEGLGVGQAAFAYVDVLRAHVDVGFFHGNELPDPAGLLEGGGRFMRHVKLLPRRALDAAALATLIGAAYADMQARLAASPAADGQ